MLPLAEESEVAEESLYSMSDLKIEVMRARGAGGQVNSDSNAFGNSTDSQRSM